MDYDEIELETFDNVGKKKFRDDIRNAEYTGVQLILKIMNNMIDINDVSDFIAEQFKDNKGITTTKELIIYADNFTKSRNIVDFLGPFFKLFVKVHNIMIVIPAKDRYICSPELKITDIRLNRVDLFSMKDTLFPIDENVQIHLNNNSIYIMFDMDIKTPQYDIGLVPILKALSKKTLSEVIIEVDNINKTIMEILPEMIELNLRINCSYFTFVDKIHQNRVDTKTFLPLLLCTFHPLISIEGIEDGYIWMFYKEQLDNMYKMIASSSAKLPKNTGKPVYQLPHELHNKVYKMLNQPKS